MFLEKGGWHIPALNVTGGKESDLAEEANQKRKRAAREAARTKVN
jgi:hypothetical protein